jgi:hypothetical protein
MTELGDSLCARVRTAGNVACVLRHTTSESIGPATASASASMSLRDGSGGCGRLLSSYFSISNPFDVLRWFARCTDNQIGASSRGFGGGFAVPLRTMREMGAEALASRRWCDMSVPMEPTPS